MVGTRKRLRCKTAITPSNYGDALLLHMVSWMPYLCLENHLKIHSCSPSEFTWDNVKYLRILCKSMRNEWDATFYVKLHIAVQWIRSLKKIVPAESLTFLRSDDSCHRILMYPYDFCTAFAVVMLPWKFFLIIQPRVYNDCHKRYDWRDYCDWYDWTTRTNIHMPPLLFQDVSNPTDHCFKFEMPSGSWSAFDEVNLRYCPLYDSSD